MLSEAVKSIRDMIVSGVRTCSFTNISNYIFFFFFFQAEDGIRDLIVTGVQTCALPISSYSLRKATQDPGARHAARESRRPPGPRRQAPRLYPPGNHIFLETLHFDSVVSGRHS